MGNDFAEVSRMDSLVVVPCFSIGFLRCSSSRSGGTPAR